MNVYQRAAQLWSLLAWAAVNHQILTYGTVSQLVGAPAAALGGWLAPIQAYCLRKTLPPLTILVVNKDTGLPGEGFIAVQDIPRAQMQVFTHEWLSERVPSPEELEQSHRR